MSQDILLAAFLVILIASFSLCYFIEGDAKEKND